MSGRQHGREEGRLDCWQLPFLGVNMDEGRVRGKAAAQKGQDRQYSMDLFAMVMFFDGTRSALRNVCFLVSCNVFSNTMETIALPRLCDNFGYLVP